MECLHISTITSYYEHKLEAGLEKLIEEHVMVCKECWKKIMNYNSSRELTQSTEEPVDIPCAENSVQELQPEEEAHTPFQHQGAEKVFA